MRENVRSVGAGNEAAMPWDGELDVRGLGRALWARRWWLFVPALTVAVLASVVVNLMTPKYKSEARVLIEGRENVFLRPEAEKPGERDQTLVDQEAVGPAKCSWRFHAIWPARSSASSSSASGPSSIRSSTAFLPPATRCGSSGSAGTRCK
jgi:hypothetical protein